VAIFEFTDTELEHLMNPAASSSAPMPPRTAKSGNFLHVSAKKHPFSGVFDLLRSHLAELDGFLKLQLTAFEPEIRDLASYCIDTSGKRIRPALVFLSGWQDPDTIQPELVRAAAVVELIHLATLVHDDIMDDADLRRSRRTAAREYGSAAAVLVGDALFAHALNLATQFPTTEVCAAVSESTRRVCAGEITQTLRRGSTTLTRADYTRIIELKTAELFRVSCFLGARLSGSEPAYTEAVSRFGRHLGIAYQIYDDLVDFFGEEKRTGKTLGTDLISGKLTLPLFVLMERLPKAEQEGLALEINGTRPAQLTHRLEQMNEFGVFRAVADAVDLELNEAEDAVAAWPTVAATPHLRSLAGLLRAQIAALRA
jgi:octaprenyl-diphosphate synthase